MTCITFKNSNHDRSVPIEHAHTAHDHIPSSPIIMLDTWGHLIWLGTSAKETDDQLITFLRKVSNESEKK
ncbi:hypothetical protein [Ornithinibacillus halotolerans]|uniref:Uncharacterized protein n=1 Tax=Ornithinibacillus halotolerans TaxID=1274357 RepID=A0A916SBT8_9BACI|nr:hypothetical protein [Ornithinibacillus halotolerans]GGA90360.1 hypothetical protein GCM10008025_36180 [Ornithinibacillus halotolerans]